MDRSRTNALERELAQLVLDALRTYDNTEDRVYQACLDAGDAIYAKQFQSPTSIHAFRDIVIAHTDRLLHLAHQQDGAWESAPDLIDREIAGAPEKQLATVDEIAAGIAALATRLEERGYQPLEIGRALACVSLSLAPIGFISLENRVLKDIEEGRDQRMRDFLDERLGEDRYPARKDTQH